MANTCKIIEPKITVKFELADVSLTTYIKISQFIESLGVSVESVAENDQNAVQAEAKEPVTSASPPYVTANKYDLVQHYGGWDKVVAIFQDVDSNPDAYTYEWKPTKIWMKNYRVLDKEDVFKISHVLGSMAKNKLIKRSEQYNRRTQQTELLFYVPIPKNAVQIQEDPKALTDGEILRNARLEHDFTLEEMQQLIGWDHDTIAKWEEGRLSISSGAKEKINKEFGEDIFAKARTEVA